MKIIRRILKWLLGIIVILCLAVCILFYFMQEKVLFDTSVKLEKEHVFKFTQPFEERYISMQDGKQLHGVLFKAEEPKGLILLLPGGRGMLDSIGVNAHIYTDLNYDLFVINYRGFGKSEGAINSEEQFNQDMQSVYDYLKKEYQEDKIAILGYSLGSGPAAALAAKNNPKVLILQAPYYSMKELSQKAFPYLPISLLQKYKFENNEYLKETKAPVAIIHGKSDKKISVKVAQRLEKDLKATDKLIILEKQGHNDFEKNEEYIKQLNELLN